MPHTQTAPACLPAHRLPMPPWAAVCQVSVAIAREAARDRRRTELETDARALVAALAAVGVSVEPVQARQQAGEHSLSEREIEVLEGISQGKSNAEIGRDLYVSEQTIKTHVRHVFGKISARDRAHAAAIGIRTGLIT